MIEVELPFRYRQIAPPLGVEAVDSILIEPHSCGRLEAGQYSPSAPKTYFRVHTSPAWAQVQSERRELASTLVYEVANSTDWPILAHLERIESTNLDD
jgi:hypothetical protein